MIGALLRLTALEEFHATLSEMFLSPRNTDDHLEQIRRFDDYCQRLKRTALAAETEHNAEIIWDKIRNAISQPFGLADKAVRIFLPKHMHMFKLEYVLNQHISDRDYAISFFDVITKKASNI